MAEAYNFTATGTHSTQAGFPGAGFSTKATELTYGVNVQGLKCGVYGECLPYGPNIRTTRLHGAGVAGASRECGVYGECLPPASKITLKELYGAGVAGAGEETGVAGKGEVGVVGHGKGVGVAGHGVVFGGLFDGGITGCVAGGENIGINAFGKTAVAAYGEQCGVKAFAESPPDEREKPNKGFPTRGLWAKGTLAVVADGSTFGLLASANDIAGTGVSASATGTRGVGVSATGASVGLHAGSPKTAILADGYSVAGISASSSNGRAGIFVSDHLAQIQLVPSNEALPPFVGAIGDLFLNKRFDASGAPIVTLYLCIRDGASASAPALWAPVQLGTSVFGQ